MKNGTGDDASSRERGAITIKTLLGIVFVGVLVFLAVKIVPIYLETRQVVYKVDELANKSAVRSSKEDDIKKGIEAIRKEHDLPADSIKLVSREPGKVQLAISYQRNIDLLVTTYAWKVDHTAFGKDL